MKYNKIFCYHIFNGIFWFRIFGYGLLFKDWRTNEPLFSDRNFADIGKPILYIGYYIIKILKPYKN